MTTGCCAQCDRRTLNSVDGLEGSYFVCVECVGDDQMVQTFNVGVDQPIAFLRDVYNALNDATIEWVEDHELTEIQNKLEYIVNRERIMV